MFRIILLFFFFFFIECATKTFYASAEIRSSDVPSFSVLSSQVGISMQVLVLRCLYPRISKFTSGKRSSCQRVYKGIIILRLFYTVREGKRTKTRTEMCGLGCRPLLASPSPQYLSGARRHCRSPGSRKRWKSRLTRRFSCTLPYSRRAALVTNGRGGGARGACSRHASLFSSRVSPSPSPSAMRNN